MLYPAAVFNSLMALETTGHYNSQKYLIISVVNSLSSPSRVSLFTDDGWNIVYFYWDELDGMEKKDLGWTRMDKVSIWIV